MKNLWFWLTMSFLLVFLALDDLSRPEMSILYSFHWSKKTLLDNQWGTIFAYGKASRASCWLL